MITKKSLTEYDPEYFQFAKAARAMGFISTAGLVLIGCFQVDEASDIHFRSVSKSQFSSEIESKILIDLFQM